MNLNLFAYNNIFAHNLFAYNNNLFAYNNI